MDSIKYQTDEKSKPDNLCLKVYEGPCLDLPTGQWKKHIKSKTKMGH